MFENLNLVIHLLKISGNEQPPVIKKTLFFPISILQQKNVYYSPSKSFQTSRCSTVGYNHQDNIITQGNRKKNGADFI